MKKKVRKARPRTRKPARNPTVQHLRRENLELEERLRKRSAELEAANQELQAFSYSISHDLRAPLRGITGFAEMLEKSCGPGLSTEAQRFLHRIRSNAAKMGELVEGLLNYSSLSWLPVTKKRVDPRPLVESVWEGLKGELADRHVTMQIDPLPACPADAMLLRQVFTNLLSNAAKYSRQRDPALIQVGSSKEGGEVVYFVKDNGAGFEMEYAGRLFGVFQRMHRPDEFEGTGVGLAIVQRIVQRHGGRVWAEARLGQGATFYFTLGTNEGQTGVHDEMV